MAVNHKILNQNCGKPAIMRKALILRASVPFLRVLFSLFLSSKSRLKSFLAVTRDVTLSVGPQRSKQHLFALPAAIRYPLHARQ
jgi:hypothetical protein